MSHRQKDLMKLLGSLEEQGWTVKRSRGGHWICHAPDGVNTVVNGGTPTDYRGMKNFKASLRRCHAKID